MAGKFAALFGAQDMTVGKPASNLIRFAVPLLIGNIAQQLYSTVDSIVVGQFVGDGALAAIGASGPAINLLLVLFMGVSVGASIMTSQYYGAKDKNSLSLAVGTTMTATLLTSLLITVIGPLITPWMMRVLQTPADIYDMACQYLVILFLGMLGSAYYNIISGILRGLGDSIMPLIFLMVACGLNIVLDVLFVAGFKMGIAGAAWATIISQLISSILCIWRMLRMKDVMEITLKTLVPRKNLVFQLIRLGLPSGLTQAIFSFAMVIVQSLTNSFGTEIIAVSTVVMRVDGFAMMPNFTFGTAMSTFAGQNIGANRMDRVEKGTKDGMRIGIIVSAILVALILIFGRYLMELFTSTEAVIQGAVHMMRILAVGYIAMGVTQILSGVMRGAGDTMTPMWISIITTVVIRVPIAYGLEFLTRNGNPMGSPDCIFISLLASWVIGAVLTVITYRWGRWKKKSIILSTDPVDLSDK